MNDQVLYQPSYLLFIQTRNLGALASAIHKFLPTK
jgi:hypothetical protein